MKKNNLVLVTGAFLLVLGVFVLAQGAIPSGLTNVFGPVPLVSCSESDGGANIYVQGFNNVGFLGPNGTIQNASGSDYCLNNYTLVEGICSSWLNANFNLSLNMSGYLATFNCSASNTLNLTYSCVNGACVSSSVPQFPPINNTNSTNVPPLNNTNSTGIPPINNTNSTGTNSSNSSV